jgi:hypothetical protein
VIEPSRTAPARATRRPAALVAALAIAATFGLAGCTGVSSGSPAPLEPPAGTETAAAQTKAEACELLNTEMGTFGDDLVAAQSTFGEGQIEASKAEFAALVQNLEEVGSQVSEPETKEQFAPVVETFEAFATAVVALENLDPEGTTELQTAMTDFQDAVEGMAAFCSA